MKLKKYFPTRLFYRFSLIIILPVFIIQLISAYVFYQTHLQNVIKKISSGTIKNILFIDKNYKENEDYSSMNLKIQFVKNSIIEKKYIIKSLRKYVFFNQEKFFIESLLENIKEPMAVKESDNDFVILIQKPKGVLNIIVNKKDLIVKTAKIFMTWNIVLSFITLTIAMIFMKNQLKPIKLLKKHIKNFSLNQEISKFKPTGAIEIRQLSLAFLGMEKGLKRFINQRTIMLAGISHDLRTPLTRMKLQLELINDSSKIYLSEDINYMESIINQYLNFTKSLKNEEKILTNIYDYINVFVRDYKKINKNITFKTKNINKDENILIQNLAFKRVLQNIFDNAFKFGTKIIITLSKVNKSQINISIENDGCGVTEKDLEKLSEPFFKIDKSRNIENKGVGLGLSIATDIVLLNNGKINFSKSKRLKGLEVNILLNFTTSFHIV